MIKMQKRLWSLLLAVCLVATMMPTMAFAADKTVGTADELTSAIASATSGDTITLGADITLTSSCTISSGTIILDLFGYTITVDADVAAFVVTESGKLIINDSNGGGAFKRSSRCTSSMTKGILQADDGGTIEMNAGTINVAYNAEDKSNTTGWYGVTVFNDSSFVMNGGTINAGWPAVATNGTTTTTSGTYGSNAKITINNGVLTSSSDYAIYAPAAGGITTINGGSITGYWGAIQVRNGTLNIKDGTLVNNGVSGVTKPEDQTDGTTPDNATAISLSSDYGPINATISGGKITTQNENAAVVATTKKSNTINLSITGGTFSSDVSKFLDDDSIITEQENGSFVVEPLTAANAVASIGNTYYKTLADAVAAVKDGGTVKMLKNASGAGIGTFKGDPKYGVKNFTIDFGGFTYTCTGPAVGSTGTESQAFHLEWTGGGSDNANVTLKNGTITSTADSGVRMLVQNYCNLTLEDMKLNGTNIGAGQYTMSNNCGQVNITGNTSITAPTNGFAFDACWAPNNGYPDGAQVTVNTTGVISGKVEFGLWGAMSEDAVKTKLNIQNGIFNGSIVVATKLAEAAETNLTITGGTFSSEPNTAYLAEGYDVYSVNDKYVVSSAITGLTLNQTSASLYSNTTPNTVQLTATLTPDDASSDAITWTSSNTAVATVSNTGFVTAVGNGTAIITAEAGPAKATCTVTVSTYSTGGGSSSGGSSGSGNKTETTTNPDGSTTTTVTKPDGSTTETTKNPDGSTEVVNTDKTGNVTTTTTDTAGNKTETVEKTDGTSETTVTNKDGSASTTTVDETGKTEAQVKLPDAVVNNAADKGEAVALPMPAVSATTDTETAPAVTVSLTGSSTSAKVEIPVADVTPGTVAVIVKADGTEEIIKTSLTTENGVAVTLSDGDTVKIVDNTKDFVDVSDSYWGSDEIAFAASRELFNGTSATTFSPETDMNRAMIITVLARYEGVDTTGGDTWYDQAVTWAKDNGVSDGSNLDASLTREQLATMLYRYAQYKGYDTSVGGMSLAEYTDADQISSYATTAMQWVNENGLITGVTDTTLDPKGSATRAQVATILMRFCENITA